MSNEVEYVPKTILNLEIEADIELMKKVLGYFNNTEDIETIIETYKKGEGVEGAPPISIKVNRLRTAIDMMSKLQVLQLSISEADEFIHPLEGIKSEVLSKVFDICIKRFNNGSSCPDFTILGKPDWKPPEVRTKRFYAIPL